MLGWTIRQRLPRIALPLKRGDEDVTLDLQQAFEVTYERADYGLSRDYTRPVRPPVSAEDEPWLREVLARRTSLSQGH